CNRCANMTNLRAKCLTAFLVFPIACFGQQLWHGTHYGMSKAKLQQRFGARLKEENNYTLSLQDPERICEADFKVDFRFNNDRLSFVDLESQSGNPGGGIGECILNQFIAKYGLGCFHWHVK